MLSPEESEKRRRQTTSIPETGESRIPVRAHLQSLEETDSTAEDEAEQLDGKPVVTWVLLAINILIFIAMWQAGRGNVASVADEFGQKNNALIQAGQTWRFITPIFLHGGLMHLLTNSLSLCWIGMQVERIYGWRKYLLVYLVAGVAGNLVSYLLQPIPSLGASGAIFGLIGAGMVFPVRFRSLVPERARTLILSQLLMLTVVNLGLSFVFPNVDNWAHMGGLVGGAFMALFLLPEVLEEKAPGLVRNLGLSLFTVCALLTVCWAAYAQWHWAKELWDPPARLFGSSKSDPWWSLRIPRRWKRGNMQYVWRNEDGSLLQIADSMHDPNLVYQVEATIDMSHRPMELQKVDGKLAGHILLPEKMAGGETYLLDIYRIAAYGRRIVVILRRKQDTSPTTLQDFNFIRNSIRFVHPPTAEDDAAAGIPASAAPNNGNPLFPVFPTLPVMPGK